MNMRNYNNESRNARMMPSPNCIPQEMVIDNVRLAAAYVPYQYMCELFSPLETLKLGTAFPELFSPYPNNSCDKRYKSINN